MSERFIKRPLYEDIVGKNDIGAPGTDEVSRAVLNRELNQLMLLDIKPGSLEHLKLLSDKQEAYERASTSWDDEPHMPTQEKTEDDKYFAGSEYAYMIYLEQAGLSGCYPLFTLLGRFFRKPDSD